MSDSMAGRVARILGGGLNSLIDAVENAAPEAVMEQAIREIDAVSDEARTALGRAAAAKHLANSRLMDANKRHEELTEQVSLAVAEGRDDLAEAAIARQMDIEAQIPALELAIADAAEQEMEYQRYLAALAARMRELREELGRFRAAKAAEAAAAAPGTLPGEQGSDLDARLRRAEEAFDRVLSRATGIGGPGIADSQNAAKLAELEQLARSNRIKERLAAIKASGKSASRRKPRCAIKTPQPITSWWSRTSTAKSFGRETKRCSSATSEAGSGQSAIRTYPYHPGKNHEPH